jgi:hypothetical protein
MDTTLPRVSFAVSAMALAWVSACWMACLRMAAAAGSQLATEKVAPDERERPSVRSMAETTLGPRAPSWATGTLTWTRACP